MRAFIFILSMIGLMLAASAVPTIFCKMQKVVVAMPVVQVLAIEAPLGQADWSAPKVFSTLCYERREGLNPIYILSNRNNVPHHFCHFGKAPFQDTM